MKITPEHFRHIKSTIEKKLCKESAKWQSSLYISNGLSHKRYCFDVSALCQFTQFYCDEVYSYANDDHIYTALSKAISELFDIDKKDFV